MKLRLQNFRCYSDTTFDLGDTGMTLLSAARGEGKSSILMGIHFALFGAGTKVTSHDATSCSVELWFDDMHIRRTRKPNRLVLNGVFEDDPAQKMIDEKFGETFATSGYIAQNAMNSFVVMSPVEKLEFLERFAFRDTDMSKVKAICKEMVAESEKALVVATANLESAQVWMERFPKPKEKKDFPLKCKREQRNLAIKNLRTKLRNCNIRIKKNRDSVDYLTSKIHALQLRNTSLSSKQEILDQTTATIESIGVVDIDKNVCAELVLMERKLSILKDLEQFDRLANTVRSLEQQLADAKSMESDRIISSIDSAQQNLWVDMNREECETSIEQLHEQMRDAGRLKELEEDRNRNVVDIAEISALESEIETKRTSIEKLVKTKERLELAKENLQCPSCNTSLRFVNKCLILSAPCQEEDLDNTIEQLRSLRVSLDDATKRLQTLLNCKSRFENAEDAIRVIRSSYEEELNESEIKKTLEEYEDYYSSNIHAERWIMSLEKELAQIDLNCASIVSVRRKLEEAKRQLQATDISSTERPSETVEELIGAISVLKQKNDDIQQRYKIADKARRDKDRLEKDIRFIHMEYEKKYGCDANEDLIENELLETKERLTSIIKEQEEYSLLIEKVDEWEKFQKELTDYTTAKQELKRKELEEIDCRAQYEASLTFKNNVLEAESIALINVIESINTHAQVFLDEFFQDHPLVAKLDAFRETKKNVKPQVNIHLAYKGGEPDLKSLSGGEFACVVLAYTLALAEMFNTPLIMLDECTSSLDQDTTNVVFEGIQRHLPDKLILCAAHQLATGGFDRVLRPSFTGEWVLPGATINAISI